MLGLFGTLNLGARSLQTQRAGVEVAGQNLANVNNAAYARQRVVIQSSATVATSLGPQGTGADAVAIQQIRNTLLDQHMSNELSVGGWLDAQQGMLQYMQAALGEVIDRNAAGASGTSTDDATVSQSGLANDLNGLFAAFQSVSTSPASLTERQSLLASAQDLAASFNQTSSRLSDLRDSVDSALSSDAGDANKLLSDIARLNDQIVSAENSEGGVANELRDVRQAKLEELSRLVKVDASSAPNGAVNITVHGNALVTNGTVEDSFEVYDAGGGQKLVRLATTGTAVSLSGGHMQGLIEVRDGPLATISSKLDLLAQTLITEVNGAHAGGFGLSGTTGASFFEGSGAGTMAVNRALLDDPSLVQLSGVAGNAGDNQVALALSAIQSTKITVLSGQTLSQSHNGAVAEVGQSLSSINGRLADQDALARMLTAQRNSVSGVSLDEEMTDLVKYQKAFEASAKLISTVDQMLETLVNLKR